MTQVPRVAGEFRDKVKMAIDRCEAGEIDGAECLKELHSLACGSTHLLYRAFKEESGDPLPQVEVVEMPLDCPECGEFHLGEEMERYWARGGEGDCPKKRVPRRRRGASR